MFLYRPPGTFKVYPCTEVNILGSFVTNFVTLRYVPGNLCSPLTDPYFFNVSDPSAVARGLKCSLVTLHFSFKKSDDFEVSFNFQTLF